MNPFVRHKAQSPRISAAIAGLALLEACSGDPSTSAPTGSGGSLLDATGGATNGTVGGATNPGNVGGASKGTGDPRQTGGNGGASNGGNSAIGGAISTGGSAAASNGGAASLGGSRATGGVPVSGGGNQGGATAGGAKATGGTSARAGSPGNGGTGTGGTQASGGTSSSGGATSKGGASVGGMAAGGAASGGTASGGSTSTATPDCNSVTGQPIINVARDGSGQYTTVQAAINSVSTSNKTRTQIRIQPGTYKEKLVINRPYITLCGQVGKASTTILTYSDSASTSNGSGGTLGTSGSASANLSASDVWAENVTFENSTGAGIQAVALLVTGSRVEFRNCRFMGYQDTLYVNGGTQYFKSCYIQGSVDFIFGGSTAVFDSCTIHNAAGGTSVTAPSTDQAVAYGLVFLGGQLTAASSVSSGSVALGRNWRPYGAAAYLRTTLGAHVNPVGWVPMGSNTLDTARFSEYQTTGAGATAANLAKRASQSKQLTATEAANYTIAKIFGTWTPSFGQ